MVGGAALLSILAMFIRIKTLEYQKEKAEVRAETLKAQLVQQKVRRKIIKENKEKQVSRSRDIAVQLEKNDEDFTGIDVLSDPNRRD